MKKQLKALTILIIFISSISLPTSGIYVSNKMNLNPNQYISSHSSKVILFGIINELEFGNITSFTTVYVICITTDILSGEKITQMNISKNSKMDFNMKLYRFKGIILKHFICGIFKSPKIKASPGSIPYSEKAELEIRVTMNGKGLSNILVNISIPGIVLEMSTYTDTNGRALFSFIPPTTGEIKIEIENKLSMVRVPIFSWKLYVDVPHEVDEGDDFTVKVRNGSVYGSGIANATVKFNGITKTTDVNGEVIFKAPEVAKDQGFKILATKDGYAEDTRMIVVKNIPKLVIVTPTLQGNKDSIMNN